MSASDSHTHVTQVTGGTHCLECGLPIAQPSDSHRAEVRAKVDAILNDTSYREATFNSKQWDKSDKRKAEREWMSNRNEALDAIMALLDAERKRWIGEVRSKLPAKKSARVGIDYSTDGQAGIIVGFNEALDAVCKVLDSLQ